MLFGCSSRLKVRSTAVVLEFLDLIKLASKTFSMNEYSPFRFFFRILH